MFNWYTKAKNWVVRFFKRKDQVAEMVAEASVATLMPESELSKKAKEVRALGPADLIRESKKIKKECDHTLTFKKQTWTRVSDKKFELQNEMMCTKCDSRKILPIG